MRAALLLVGAIAQLASWGACGRTQDACAQGDDLETWTGSLSSPSGGPVHFGACGVSATFRLGSSEPSYLLRRADVAPGSLARLEATFSTTCTRARVQILLLDERTGERAGVIEDLGADTTKRLTLSHRLTAGTVAYVLAGQSEAACDVTVSNVERVP